MGESSFNKRVFICQNSNAEIRLDSTSGGVFSAISSAIINKSGVVFGACFDDNFDIVHSYATSIEQLHLFRGSKYVRSKLGDTFTIVKNFLDDGRYVLFTGTPCQVAGLKLFLKKEYEKLYTMDLVCYSISTPESWRYYLEYLRVHNKISLDQVSRIKFRDKSKYGYEYSQMTFYDKESKIIYSAGPETDKFLRSFVSKSSTCTGCFKCKYKTVNRVCDFTAWDCYNVYEYNKNMDDNQGTNHLMIHSEKGYRLFLEISSKIKFTEVDVQKAVDSEPAMTEVALPGELHGKFENLIKNDKNPFEVYFNDSLRVKIERMMRKFFSKIGVYKYIKRILKK